ncbi:MAG: type II secretion system protein GspG [SAR86 cluster bacterium]|uniref:Type II secretion system core protein G n=1 Tax=SAR86 cluster bacterium TaxID=2030880 RepID=A0A2A5C9I6_9GAMM|nr:MAG: type II secretion system protein GspG [SAR86 cluster bacterium]
MNKTRNIKGFTLVELLVVLAILALIAGIVGPQVLRQFNGAKADTAQLQIKDLSASLDLFLLDMGRYPTTEEGLSALIIQPSGLESWNGPYLRNASVPKDPWAGDYLYQFTPSGTFEQFSLMSYGADLAAGGSGDNADITNTQ